MTEVFDCGTWEVVFGLYARVTTCHIHAINMSQPLNGELTVFQYVTTCHTFFIKVKYILTLHKELM